MAEQIPGTFERSPQYTQEFIKEIVSNYHFRTGYKHDDGSLGDIKITLKQFNDALAYAISEN